MIRTDDPPLRAVQRVPWAADTAYTGGMMPIVARFIAACFCAYAASTACSEAQTAPSPSPVPTATPSPAPSATPSGPSDPCTTLLAIVTRPTVTTSTCVVKPKHVLVENGYTNTVTTGTGGGNVASYPQSFIRVGMNLRALELDITPPNGNRSSVGGIVVSGSTDSAFGIKYEAGYSARWVYGVNGSVSVPSGSAAFTSGGTQYTGNFNWGYTVNSVISLSGTAGYNSLTGFAANGTVERFAQFVPTLLLYIAVPPKSQAFVEYAYFSHAGLGVRSKSLIDFGYQFDPNPHIQLDVEYGFAPTLINGQRQHYLGAGLSFIN